MVDNFNYKTYLPSNITFANIDFRGQILPLVNIRYMPHSRHRV